MDRRFTGFSKTGGVQRDVTGNLGTVVVSDTTLSFLRYSSYRSHGRYRSVPAQHSRHLVEPLSGGRGGLGDPDRPGSLVPGLPVHPTGPGPPLPSPRSGPGRRSRGPSPPSVRLPFRPRGRRCRFGDPLRRPRRDLSPRPGPGTRLGPVELRGRGPERGPRRQGGGHAITTGPTTTTPVGRLSPCPRILGDPGCPSRPGRRPGDRGSGGRHGSECDPSRPHCPRFRYT